MLFTDSKPCSAQNIRKLFDHFATTSGLHLNTTKSQAFLGGDPADNDYFLHLLGIRNHNLPVKYSGALSSGMCLPLLDKIRRRIEGWAGHLLSHAGRLELLKTVLSSFHNYWTAGFTLPRKIQRSIEQILRRFLWGGPKLQAKIHHVNWDLICHPKQEGGLGIRNIKDWSKASMAARFWEVITHSKSLWTDWIWNRYLKRKSPWEVNSNSGCSWVWRQILSNRDWIKAEVKYIIFSGHTINILHDPWLEGRGLAHHLQGSFSSLPFLSPSATLSAIIKDGKWIRPPRWPSQLTALWPTILEIEIGGVGDDEIIWPHCKQGVLSTQAAWAYLRHSRPPAPWKNWIWANHQTPKHCFTAWLAILNRLPTSDRLIQRGLQATTTCQLCLQCLESANHLFFDCAFSSYIWKTILRKAGLQPPPISSITNWTEWLDSNCKAHPLNTLIQCILSTTIWFIWAERNARIFRGKAEHKSRVLGKILTSIKIQFQGHTVRAMASPALDIMAAQFSIQVHPLEEQLTEVLWCPPPLSWCKVNSDGSLGPDRAGYGHLIRDSNAHLITGAATRSDLFSINILELKALLAGLEQALASGFTQVWLESDSKTAISWVLGRGTPPWTATRTLRSIQTLLSKVQDWKISHIPREGNKPADFLASFQQDMGTSIISNLSMPSALRTLILDDATGKTQLRSKWK
ncbi:hypothetical protein QJS10_CPB13g00247 [Acorus calamus]|uniref:RNase H type-1 domain-containing protein n=1 Tax=Acorus calamus TaxID=4465 RepID=A0AAV9DGU0_ACOCL|nr:hypothetical protein QJS10_CPB13g00247 [Acorus calamus]